MVGAYIPDLGDIVWLSFDPQSGHEQAGRRPALVLTSKEYNDKTSLAIVCPITSQIKKFPFVILLPHDITIKGVVLTDQVKSMDWRARQAEYAETLAPDVVEKVQEKLRLLLGLK
jgi:mRNA interferase MazF